MRSPLSEPLPRGDLSALGQARATEQVARPSRRRRHRLTPPRKRVKTNPCPGASLWDIRSNSAASPSHARLQSAGRVPRRGGLLPIRRCRSSRFGAIGSTSCAASRALMVLLAKAPVSACPWHRNSRIRAPATACSSAAGFRPKSLSRNSPPEDRKAGSSVKPSPTAVRRPDQAFAQGELLELVAIAHLGQNALPEAALLPPIVPIEDGHIRPVCTRTGAPRTSEFQDMDDSTDDGTVTDPFGAALFDRKVGRDDFPLRITQPEQFSTHATLPCITLLISNRPHSPLRWCRLNLSLMGAPGAVLNPVPLTNW